MIDCCVHTAKRLSGPKIVLENSKKEQVNGKELRVFKLEKPGSNVTFFLIHGLGGELDQFSEQFEFLSRSDQHVNSFSPPCERRSSHRHCHYHQ